MPNQWHLTASTPQPRARQRFLTVLLPYPQGRQPARVQARNLAGCLAVDIIGLTLTHTVVFRTEAKPAAPVTVEGTKVAGDVFAMARTAKGQVKAVFAVKWEPK